MGQRTCPQAPFQAAFGINDFLATIRNRAWEAGHTELALSHPKPDDRFDVCYLAISLPRPIPSLPHRIQMMLLGLHYVSSLPDAT
jgi:hypothetical protein